MPFRGQLSQPEIEDLGLAALRDEDIVGLDVAMDDALGVGGIESIGDLDRQFQQLVGLERLAGYTLPQRLTFEQVNLG